MGLRGPNPPPDLRVLFAKLGCDYRSRNDVVLPTLITRSVIAKNGNRPDELAQIRAVFGFGVFLERMTSQALFNELTEIAGKCTQACSPAEVQEKNSPGAGS